MSKSPSVGGNYHIIRFLILPTDKIRNLHNRKQAAPGKSLSCLVLCYATALTSYLWSCSSPRTAPRLRRWSRRKYFRLVIICLSSFTGRGTVGETALHSAFILTDLRRSQLKQNPRLRARSPGRRQEAGGRRSPVVLCSVQESLPLTLGLSETD